MKRIPRLVAIMLSLCLLMTITVNAEEAWVKNYRKRIQQDFKPATDMYCGLFDLGPDGSPELLIARTKGGKTTVYVYYITKGGSVRKSSKSASLGKNATTPSFGIYDTGGGDIVALSATSNGGTTNTRFEFSQTTGKVVRVKELYRQQGSSYYVRGKKTTYAKYMKQVNEYANLYDSYYYGGRKTACKFYSLPQVISQFEYDARQF